MEDIAGILFKYYGLDWLAMILTFFSINSFKDKNIRGFIYGGLACLCWMAFNFLAISIAGVIANLFFMYMHFKGFKEWQKDKKKEATC
jgi:mannose/fructose/N-acetylgalactosamine-specific phosphotransferase system component IIC